MSETQTAEADPLSALAQEIERALGDAVTGHAIAFGELTVSIAASRIGFALTHLREPAGLAFVQLIDLTAVDYPDRPKRFDVVYHLLSLTRNLRLRLRVEAEEDEVLPSVAAIFPVANWFEREVFDMYGILFSDHPDMRRILTDYGFQGHPLRKDFPLTGHVEVRYDIELKRVVYEPVKLPQDFRSFDFMSPWEGAHYILPGDEKSRDVKP